MVKQFKKVMVANRGEIAVRIMDTLQQMGITTVAVYHPADVQSLHVRRADEAYPLHGATLAETYLNATALVELARHHGVDAIHPGYGFLSENGAFAKACEEAGITFIGPSAAVIDRMGDKIVAKDTMKQAGVPVLPDWNGSLNTDVATIAEAADGIGYPLLVKAAAGGGGKGMRLVKEATHLEEALRGAASEAKNAFGDERVFLEKYVEKPRHVEFQIFGDDHGNVIHLYERECSIQRRHQKIIEETPCVALDEKTRQAMAQAAVAAGHAVSYSNAGTVEFLLDEDGSFYFLEMNTRLQVEHPITEQLIGRDLVREQIRVAEGHPLSLEQDEVVPRGHSIECRLYAEDPHRQFMPSIGTLLQYDVPHSPYVRLDSGVEVGDRVTVNFDPMLAKLVVSGETREAALERLDWVLGNSCVLGVTHNLPFLRRVINHPAFQQGDTHTHFLEQHHDAVFPTAEIPEEVLDIAALMFSKKPQGRGNTSSEGGASTERAQTPWQTVGPWRIQ